MGAKHSTTLQQWRLKEGVIPSIFPDCPKYMTKAATFRSSPDTKRQLKENSQLALAVKASLKSAEDYANQYVFSNWTKLVFCLKSISINNYWSVIETETSVLFLHLKMAPSPQIEKSVIIDNQCLVTTYLDKIPLKKIGKFSFPFKCSDMNDLEYLLNSLENICSTESSNNDILLSVYDFMS